MVPVFWRTSYLVSVVVEIGSGYNGDRLRLYAHGKRYRTASKLLRCTEGMDDFFAPTYTHGRLHAKCFAGQCQCVDL